MDPSAHRFNASSLPSNMSLSAHLRELAYVRRNPIEGRKPIFAQLAPDAGRRSSTLKIGGVDAHPNAANGGHPENGNKAGDFVQYSDSDDEDFGGDLTGLQPQTERLSCNFVDCIGSRELGLPRVGGNRFFSERLSSEYGTRHMLSNGMMKETSIVMPNMDKIFCSKWLSHRQVVFGTKCNKLMVFDVNTRQVDHIPSLSSSENSSPPEAECGIHAIEINPSKTLLATGGKQANDIAIYRLPTLDPICVGEGAHKDWIFDMTWLDDQFVVSGSRDGTLGVWRVSDDIVSQVTKSEVPSFLYTTPDLVKISKNTDRVRSMCFNKNQTEIAVISCNGWLHCWDANRMKQIMSKKLPHGTENVCLAVDNDCSTYAVGSKQNTDLIDSRTLQAVKKITSRNGQSNIRSVSFQGNILTIGNGNGVVLFWDVRAGKHLESTMNTNRAVSLKASRGWVNQSDQYVNDYGNNQRYSPAIYTHCYDTSGTRLFAAGGPLQIGLKGNYLSLFQ